MTLSKKREAWVTPHVDALHKLTTFVNGGGAVVVFTAATALAALGVPITSFLIPALFFSAGIVFSGLRLVREIGWGENQIEVQRIVKKSSKKLENASDVLQSAKIMRDQLEQLLEVPDSRLRFLSSFLPYSSLVCFVLGIASGFGALLLIDIPPGITP